MRLLRRIGALFSWNALGYWNVFYVILLVVWGTLTIWRVASGAVLETPAASSTLIKIDLLEAVAFLAAWSLLLITLTTKIVNKGRDIESATHESIRKVEEMSADIRRHNRKMEEVSADIRRHEESHPDVQDEVDGMKVKVSEIANGFSKVREVAIQLKRKNERITEENEQLRRQLEAMATKDSHGDN